MSQASSWGLPTVGPATPVAYSTEGNESLDAILSQHLFTARPTYAVQGTVWAKDTASSPLIIEVYFFDGTDDVLMYSIDVAANTFTPVLNTGGSTGKIPLWENLPNDIPFNAGFGGDMTGEDLAVQVYGELVLTRPITFEGENGYIDTVATGAAVILDIEKNGVSIYSVKPRFAISSNTLTAGTLTTTTAVANDRITFKVTQVGSTIVGQKLRFTSKVVMT